MPCAAPTRHDGRQHEPPPPPPGLSGVGRFTYLLLPTGCRPYICLCRQPASPEGWWGCEEVEGRAVGRAVGEGGKGEGGRGKQDGVEEDGEEKERGCATRARNRRVGAQGW